jgi:hypothetical protein
MKFYEHQYTNRAVLTSFSLCIRLFSLSLCLNYAHKHPLRRVLSPHTYRTIRLSEAGMCSALKQMVICGCTKRKYIAFMFDTQICRRSLWIFHSVFMIIIVRQLHRARYRAMKYFETRDPEISGYLRQLIQKELPELEHMPKVLPLYSLYAPLSILCSLCSVSLSHSYHTHTHSLSCSVRLTQATDGEPAPRHGMRPRAVNLQHLRFACGRRPRLPRPQSQLLERRAFSEEHSALMQPTSEVNL